MVVSIFDLVVTQFFDPIPEKSVRMTKKTPNDKQA
jgi:hypothetical protein